MIEPTEPGERTLTTLSLTSFFVGLPGTLKSAIMAAGRSRHYHDGATLHRRGDSGGNFSIVERGAVRFSRTDAEGELIALTTVSAGSAFGEIPLFADLPRAYDAVAVGPSDIRELSPYDLDQLIAREPQLRAHLLRHITRQLVFVLDLLDDERRLPLAARLAKYLLTQTTDQAGDDNRHAIAIRLTQTHIAEDLAVSRVALSKALRQLRQRNLIETQYGAILITDPDNLARFVTARGQR